MKKLSYISYHNLFIELGTVKDEVKLEILHSRLQERYEKYDEVPEEGEKFRIASGPFEHTTFIITSVEYVLDEHGHYLTVRLLVDEVGLT